MGKNKLKKFEELKSFPNVKEFTGFFDVIDFGLKGKWNSGFFKNNNPVVLELACGRGDYTLELAKLHPGKNFIGIDIKGHRIWKGAKKALEENIENAAFLRTPIEKIADFFEAEEIDEIWITFPDPFPAIGSKNRRLTSPPFLEKYKQVLKQEGIIHLKTDADSLYKYSLEVAESSSLKVLEKTNDLYSLPSISEDLQIKTHYERMHLQAGKKIKYLKFTF
ncbi:MAG: tRNA (guanosine(46)-N7)-methyltransferase TrmB [Chitinophagaceae bacterium]|nr:MAG: tRNA (guanosine(46)-N7)-methyltransferase TrmB [Chitinophagaceae bacterium]